MHGRTAFRREVLPILRGFSGERSEMSEESTHARSVSSAALLMEFAAATRGLSPWASP
jgi:hypothetical protein